MGQQFYKNVQFPYLISEDKGFITKIFGLDKDISCPVANLERISTLATGLLIAEKCQRIFVGIFRQLLFFILFFILIVGFELQQLGVQFQQFSYFSFLIFLFLKQLKIKIKNNNCLKMSTKIR